MPTSPDSPDTKTPEHDDGPAKELRARHEQIADMLAREQERHATADSFVVRREIARHIRSLKQQLNAIDLELEERAQSAGALSSSRPLSRWRIIAAVLFFLAAAVLLILPFWIVAYPPLLDYPNHLARAFILAHLHDPAFHFSEFYASDWGPYPYLTMDVVLVALQRVCSIFTAGRILLSVAVVGVPFAAWFFIREANPKNFSLATWSLLGGYNMFFLWGLVNNQLGVALVLFVLGLWLRYSRRPRWLLWSLLFVLVTALYFTHLFGFGLAGLLISAYIILTRKGIRQLLLAWLLFVPGGVIHLFERFALRGSSTSEGWAFGLPPLAEKWQDLGAFVQGYSMRLDHVILIVLAICFVAAVWRNREFAWNRPWNVITAGVFVLYWVFPVYGVGGTGGDAHLRLLPFTFLLLPTVAHVGRRGRWLALAGLVLFLAQSVTIIRTFRAKQPELAGLAQAFAVTPPGAKVLPIVAAKDEAPEHRPYAHFADYGVIKGGWFSPYLFAQKGVVPLEIKVDLPTPDGFWSLEYSDEPDWQEIAEAYDYVWAYNVPDFKQSLDEIGEVVYQSGDLRLYRIKKDARKDQDDDDQSP